MLGLDEWAAIARRRHDRVSEWKAFAKLTLSLRVLGVRADGFHELDALTVSVSEPHDVLSITIGGDGVEVELSGPAAAGVTDGGDNLAARAALALLDDSTPERRAIGVRIAIHKQIPAGGGLGGGSADAAAVLVALDRLLELGLSTDELAAIGAGLGSDVPFCVRGGAARMRGRGERIEPATVPPLHVLVAVPPFSIATPAVYEAWDELGGPVSTRMVPGPAGSAILPTTWKPRPSGSSRASPSSVRGSSSPWARPRSSPGAGRPARCSS